MKICSKGRCYWKYLSFKKIKDCEFEGNLIQNCLDAATKPHDLTSTSYIILKSVFTNFVAPDFKTLHKASSTGCLQ